MKRCAQVMATRRFRLLLEELEPRLTPTGGAGTALSDVGGTGTVMLPGAGPAAVSQTLTSISISPASVILADKGQKQFTATALDQSGQKMATQPKFTWSIASGGVGQINSNGLYTGPNSGTGTATVRATSGHFTGTASITIQALPPVITQQASGPSTVTGTQAALKVVASDPNGASLTYSWSVTGQPAGAKTPTFNNASNSQPTATFYQAGSYTFSVTVADSLGLSATSSTGLVTVVQTPSNNLSLTPASVTLPGGQTQQFTANAADQFGKPITAALSGTWQVSGVGQISTTGLYTASSGSGSATVNFSSSSGASAQASVTVTVLPPAAPTNLQATVQNGQVKLQWNTNSTNQTGFVVQYLPCCIPNPQWTTLVTVASANNSYTFTPPANLGPTVEYQVYETNAVGSSAPSNAVTVTTPAAAPTGLSAAASNVQISLSWAASLGATSYDVYRATSAGQEGNTPIATGVTAPTFTDSNLTAGTTYYYEVTAVDAAGQSPMSSEVSATPPQAPAAPTGLAVLVGATNVSLSWNAVSGATGYNIYRGTNSGGESFDTSVTGTAFNDTGLTAFTTYYYQVSAVNANGESARSTELSGTPGGNDWFTNNLPDLGLQALARTDFDQDGSIGYNDMLGLLSTAVTETGSGTMSSTVVASLQAIAGASGAAYLNMAAPLAGLTQNLVNGGQYQVTTALAANSTTASQLQSLINQWFLGESLPTIDTQYESTSGYVLANQGTLFGSSSGPLYTDIVQGEEGDCWLMASFAEIAYKRPDIIQGSFTDDGLVLENGVQVHVWTYEYHNGNTPEYMTLNNYFPSNGGNFMYADAFQPIANTHNVLWAPLMEKAYASLYGGGYANLNGGWAQNVLPLETGGSGPGDNPFGSESAYIAAIQSPNTLLTLASWSTNYGFVADHDYAVISVTGTGSTALFQLYNPWGSYQPPAITWAQLTQGGDFSQDGDTVVTSAVAIGVPSIAPGSGGLAVSLAGSGFADPSYPVTGLAGLNPDGSSTSPGLTADSMMGTPRHRHP
jgi:hypothetical protein